MTTTQTGRFIITEHRHGMVVIAMQDGSHDVALFGDDASVFRMQMDTAEALHTPSPAFPTIDDLIDCLCDTFRAVMEPTDC